MTVARLPLVASHPTWRAAQFFGVLLTVALLYAFLAWPTVALPLLWDRVIPLLPAVFLVNPLLWRNVCPLASLNELGGRLRESPAAGSRWLPAAWAVGIALLALLVPARRFLFNEQGLAMTVTVSAVALLALGAGFLVSRRGGFCNTICPVLPVEKLYSQAPLLEFGSARCTDCNRCVSAGCPDLAGRKAAVQTATMGRAVHWLAEPFGLFAAAFPGFIVGYFTTVNGPLSSAPVVYGTVLFWSVASLLVLGGAVLASRARPVTALFALGAVSIGTYYWFATPKLVTAYGGGRIGGEILRSVVMLALIVWAVRGWRRMQRAHGKRIFDAA